LGSAGLALERIGHLLRVIVTARADYAHHRTNNDQPGKNSNFNHGACYSCL
jgi:hypothetical protein